MNTSDVGLRFANPTYPSFLQYGQLADPAQRCTHLMVFGMKLPGKSDTKRRLGD